MKIDTSILYFHGSQNRPPISLKELEKKSTPQFSGGDRKIQVC